MKRLTVLDERPFLAGALLQALHNLPQPIVPCPHLRALLPAPLAVQLVLIPRGEEEEVGIGEDEEVRESRRREYCPRAREGARGRAFGGKSRRESAGEVKGVEDVLQEAERNE